MTYIQASSLKEALAIATERRQKNPRTIFRGQQENWPVRATLARLTEDEVKEAYSRFDAFTSWVSRTPGLEQIEQNEDHILAIAQHYGIPTPFIDFTADPAIAAFFAVHGMENRAEPQTAYLLTLDLDDLEEFWQQLPVDDYPCSKFLDFDVSDLWRLHAQHGCFLYAPYKNPELFYDCDRIVFPVMPEDSILVEELVYPSRKSSLEIILDQFFMIEMMHKNSQIIRQFNCRIHEIPEDEFGYDLEVFPTGLPPVTSWNIEELETWLSLPGENFNSSYTSSIIQISFDNPNNALTNAAPFIRAISTDPSLRQKTISWKVICPALEHFSVSQKHSLSF